MERFSKELVEYPTYLSVVANKSEKIYLCTGKSEKQLIDLSEKTNTYAKDNSFECIGSPLETDLAHPDTKFNEFCNVNNAWEAAENEHHPLSYNTALQIINEHNKNVAFKQIENCNIPIFCVCNGEDANKTILLGSLYTQNMIKRITLTYKGFYSDNDQRMKLDQIRKMHLNNLNNFGTDAITTCELTSTYSMMPPHLNSSHFLLIKLVKDASDDSFKHLINSKLIAGIHTGDIISSNHTLWLDLKLLEKLINVASNLDETVDILHNGLCNVDNSEEKLISVIQTQINSNNTSTFIDQLWNLLKSEPSVRSLQQLFDKFLRQIYIQKDFKCDMETFNNTILFSFIKSVIEKRILLSPVTKFMAVYFLIELGLEKLKFDYCSSLSKYLNLDHTLNKWSSKKKIFEEITQISPKYETYFIETPELITTYLKESETNFKTLINLHVVNELCELITNNSKLDNESLVKINRDIYDKYMKNELAIQKLKEERYVFQTDVKYDSSIFM